MSRTSSIDTADAGRRDGAVLSRDPLHLRPMPHRPHCAGDCEYSPGASMFRNGNGKPAWAEASVISGHVVQADRGVEAHFAATLGHRVIAEQVVPSDEQARPLRHTAAIRVARLVFPNTSRASVAWESSPTNPGD